MKTQLIKGLMGVALIGLSALSFSTTPPPPSSAKHSISKELDKQTTTGGVTTFDWVIKYENLSEGTLKDVEIKDTFSGNQSYVPSSEQHPNGWSAAQSGNNIQWNAGLVGNGGYSRPFSPIPTSGFNIPSGGKGDGWAPIPYTAPNGDFRIYYINHHKIKSFTGFGCVGACTSSTWPKMLPEGDPNANETTSTPNNVKTAIINNKLYYSVTRNPGASTVVAQDWGVGCYNLINDTECGYTPLSTNPSSRSITLGIDGPYKVGNKLYFLDSDLFVHCFDPSGSSACGSHDLKTSTTMGILNDSSLIPTSGANNSGNRIGAHVDGNNIYFDIGNAPRLPRATGGKVLCFDTVGMRSCSGWSGAVASSREDYGYNAYFHRNTSGTPTHLCVAGKNFVWPNATTPLTKECYDLNNGSTAVLPDVVLPTYVAMASPDLKILLSSDLYIPSLNQTFFVSMITNNVFCYNWTTSSVCGTDKIVSNYSDAYGYAQTIDNNGCVWVLGDKNRLWSYDPETSETPCQKEEFDFEGTFDASKNWCATEDPEWSYTQFQINNIRGSDFEELIVEFLDSNGTVIKTADITGASSYSQGLFTGVFSGRNPIHYRIKVKLASGVTQYTTHPVVTIGVDGPPQEFCFSTTVDCPNTEPVVNSVTASVLGQGGDPILGGESIADVSDEVTIDAESSCKDDVVIDPPEPESCLVIEPKLECIKGKGWHISLINSSTSFNPTKLDVTSLTPGVTVVGSAPSWSLSGATPNSTVKLSANGVMKNGGSEKGTDLCCSTEIEVEIPDEECEVIIKPPEEACMVAKYEGPFYDKAKKQWAFNLGLTSLNGSTINEVKVTPVTSGVTLTNGPIYPIGTPSLSFTGITAGQTAEFKFCGYNKDEMNDNETFDCCKVNLKVEIGEGGFPKELPKKEVVK